jgi:hypothetical protein
VESTGTDVESTDTAVQSTGISVQSVLTNISAYSFMHSFIPLSVLRQAHSLFQSEFFTECDLVLPL